MKVDKYGNMLYNKTYGGAKDDFGIRIIASGDGNYMVIAKTNSFGTLKEDFYVLKINENGDTLWTKNYGGAQDEFPSSILKTHDNCFVIVGYTQSYSPVATSVYVLKINNNGDTLWTKVFHEENYNWGESIIETSNKDLIILSSTSNVSTNHNYTVYRIDEFGNLIWKKHFAKNGNEYVSNILENVNGYLFLVGIVKYTILGKNDLFMSKLDKDGNEIWEVNYGGSSDFFNGRLCKTDDNNFIISGSLKEANSQFEDAFLMKVNSEGDTLWTKTYGWYYADGIGFALQTSDKGFIGVGYTENFGGTKLYLIKTNPDGYTSIDDFTVEKNKILIHPNPCSDMCIISINETIKESVLLQIYNALGRLVFEQNIDCTNKSDITLNTTALPSGGVYSQDFK